MNILKERRENFKSFNNYFFIRYISVVIFFLTVYCSLNLFMRKKHLLALSMILLPVLIFLINFYTAQVLNGKSLDLQKINKCLYIIIIIVNFNIIFSIINAYLDLIIALAIADFLTIICYRKIKTKLTKE